MNDDDQPGKEPGTTTRRALFVGAGAVGASVVLTGCGGGQTGGGAPAGETKPSAGGAAGTPLAKTSDIPVGGGKIFADQHVVVTQPKAGEFKGFSNICTHQNCPLTSINGGTINCNCHFSKFSIEDGSVKKGPATRALPTKNIKVEGDKITLA